MHHPTTRRSVIRTGLMSLTGLSVLALGRAPGASAEKKKMKKVTAASRANDYISFCSDLGGEATVDAVKPGGVTVTCTAAQGDSETCTFTSKGQRCHLNAEGPSQGTTVPDWAGDVPDFDIQPGGERKRRKR